VKDIIEEVFEKILERIFKKELFFVLSYIFKGKD
jgi:hypothetical protein